MRAASIISLGIPLTAAESNTRQKPVCSQMTMTIFHLTWTPLPRAVAMVVTVMVTQTLVGTLAGLGSSLALDHEAVVEEL